MHAVQRLAAAKLRKANSGKGSIGEALCRCPIHKAGQRRNPDYRWCDDPRGGPSVVLRFDERIHGRRQSQRRQAHPDDVDTGARNAPQRRAEPERQRITDRHGDRRKYENPTPAQEINSHSAQQGPQRKGGSRPSGPYADRLRLARFVKHRVDQRQRPGNEEGGSQALNQARGDQHRRRTGGGSHNRAGPESQEPEPYYRNTSEHIRDRPAGQDRRRHRQQIAVDDPLLQGEAATDVALDGR